MIAIDTNVFIRFLVDDDPEQNRIARGLLSKSSAEEPVFVGAVVLAETVWLLSRRLGYSGHDITTMLRDLLASDAVIVEYGEQLGMIVGGGEAPGADIADYLIAWAGAAAGCSRTVTFDIRAARSVPGMELLT